MNKYEEVARAIVIKVQFQDKPLHFDQAIECAKVAVKLVRSIIEIIEINVGGFVSPNFKYFLETVLEKLNEMESEK